METPPISRAIKRAATLMGRQTHAMSQEVWGEGFTFRQAQIIRFLRENSPKGDLFQRDIEEEFSIRRPTATGILKLMEKNGFLRRESVPYDQRLKKLVLTDKAAALDARCAAKLAEMDRRLTQGIPREDLEKTVRTLDLVCQNLVNGQKCP